MIQLDNLFSKSTSAVDNVVSFFKRLDIKPLRDSEVRVLYIGTVTQVDLVSALSKAWPDKNYTFKIFSCYSKSATGFSAHQVHREMHAHQVEIVNIGSIDLNNEADIISTLKPEIISQEVDANKFDIIFGILELHYLINWRKTILDLLAFLNPMGCFVYGELYGNISLLDGRLSFIDSSIPSEFVQSLIEYKKKRDEKRFWFPELSSSDYSAVHHFVSHYFFNIEQQLSEKNCVSLSQNFLGELVKNKTFPFLLEEALLNECFEIFFSENKSTELDYQLHLFAAENFNEKRLDISDASVERTRSIVKSSRNTANFTEGFRAIKDFEINGLARKVLDILWTNDICFHNVTKYTGIFIAQSQNNANQELVFMHDDYAEVKEKIKKARNSVTSKNAKTILFEELHIEHNVYFVYIPKKGNFKPIDDKLFADWDTYRESLNQGVVKVLKELDKYGGIKNEFFVFGNIFGKNDSFSVEVDWESNSLSKLNREEIKSLLESIYRIHFKSDEVGSDGKAQIIGYFPAVLREKESHSLDTKAEVLGGFFIKEELLLYSEDELQRKISYSTYSLILARNEMIARVSSYLLHRASLLTYSTKDQLVEQRKSQIAAIGTRNISHNIGSHVIPSLKSNNSFDNYEPKALKKLYDDFAEYVGQRNDFVNQLSSGASKWATSVWFCQNLMTRFLKQYLLLEHIGYSEGLRAYDYSKYSKSQPKSGETGYTDVDAYDNQLCFSKGEKLLIYGDVTVRDSNLIVVKSNNGIEFQLKWEGNGLHTPLEIKEEQFFEILKKQEGRKFRIIGKYAADASLTNWSFVEGKIMIKVRLRKYQKWDTKNRQWENDIYSESAYLGKEHCFDILSHDSFTQFLKAERQERNALLGELMSKHRNLFKERAVFFGVVQMISGQKISILSHCGNYDFCCSQVITDLKLSQGERVVFCFLTDESIEVLERSFSQHLISPNPSCTAEMVEKNDILVSIPGGLSGYQSFYTILENVIRNAIKHNWPLLSDEEKIGRNLVVKVELAKVSNLSVYVAKVWTNLTNLNYKTFVTDSDSVIDDDIYKLPNKLNIIFKADVVHDLRGLEASGLGSIETKVSAAFLSYTDDDFYSKARFYGDGIILDEKSPTQTSAGYIKASVVYESFNNVIVPRLGLRFAFQPQRRLTAFWESGLTHKQDISAKFLVLWEFDEKIVQQVNSEMILFVCGKKQTESQTNKGSNIIQLIENIILLAENVGLKSDGLTERENEVEVMEEVEKYPYRFFYCNIERNRKATIDLLKKYRDMPIVKFIMQRIVFVDWLEISSDNKLKEWEGLALDLYQLSNNRFVPTSQKNVKDAMAKGNQGLHVDGQISSSSDDVDWHLHPPTIPDELKMGRTQSSEKQEMDIEGYMLFNYTRHSTFIRKNDSPCLHHEAYSGSSISYGFISRYLDCSDKQSDNERLYIKQALIENALIRVLVADERISSYYYNLRDQNAMEQYISMKVSICDFASLFGFPVIDEPIHLDAGQRLDTFECTEDNDFVNQKTIESDYFQFRYFDLKSDRNYIFNTLVLHESLFEMALDRHLAQKPEMKRSEASIELMRSLKLQFPSVIFTSGKNTVPSNQMARIIPFTSVAEVLMKPYPDKLLLTQMLLNSKI